ncbi:restriction endonuclease subunit S [Aliivibrio salmonicida]|uniref:restriction endonuclease subunit S n=1 Tax=Aliivibrio salmonicida TaxID=40269 RepID=UPI00406C026F
MTCLKGLNWNYGVLEDLVSKGSSNISLNKIKDDVGEFPVFGAKGYVQGVSFFQQENDYLAIIKDGAGIGRVSDHPAKSSILATMQYLIPKGGFELRFIKYCLESIDFSEYRTGSTIPHIYFKDYKSTPVPLPSIPEQKRIVALLDTVFADLEQTRAKTEQNLKNARELFDSYMQQVFSQKGEGWTSVKLKDICSKITDGVHKKPNYIDEGVPFLKINNLTVGTGISFKNTSYISKEDHELFCKRTNPEKGDILISKDGTIGIVRIIDTDIEFSIFVSLALVKPIDKSMSHYLKFVLESPDIQGQIQPQGAALKHLYLRDLREFSIPIAPASEQEEIVKKLDFMQNRVECLEKNYQCKLKAIDELKKSILQKAFSGELTHEQASV